MHAGDAEEIPTPPQNLVFGHQTTPQAPPPKAHALDACTVTLIIFFIIFIFSKLPNYPSIHVIIIKQNHNEKTKKLIIVSLIFFSFKGNLIF